MMKMEEVLSDAHVAVSSLNSIVQNNPLPHYPPDDVLYGCVGNPNEVEIDMNEGWDGYDIEALKTAWRIKHGDRFAGWPDSNFDYKLAIELRRYYLLETRIKNHYCEYKLKDSAVNK